MTQGASIIKLLKAVIVVSSQARLFVSTIHFNTSLIFAGKAEPYYSGASY
jgi:hypothetical protein